MRYLDFEKPISELERKIEELVKFSEKEKIDVSFEIRNLEGKLLNLRKEVYQNLTPWQRIQIARHPERPYALDYIGKLFSFFMEFHGDRHFSDDKAMITGIGRIRGKRVALIAQQKGRETKEKLERNFGCAHPEGYRKALRIMKMASRFSLPIICMVDTPGAYPGIGAEERGQAEAIAVNIREMFSLSVPVIVVIIGEGGSGGALGIGVGDVICLLENAYYSVISPEGCAAILWKDKAKSDLAASALKLTAKDLLGLGIIDDVVPEPLGGAHKDFAMTCENLEKCLVKHLEALSVLSPEELIERRYEKFRKMGVYSSACSGKALDAPAALEEADEKGVNAEIQSLSNGEKDSL